MLGASADANWVVFSSRAPSVTGDPSGGRQALLLRDVQGGTSTTIAVSDQYTGAAVSDSGRFVAYDQLEHVGGETTRQVWYWDRATPLEHLLLSQGLDGRPGDDASMEATITADGTRVAFLSHASNLLPGDTIDSPADVFVRDVAAATTTLVSASPTGWFAGFCGVPAISADGSTVVFGNWGTILDGEPDQDGRGHIYSHAIGSGTTTRVSATADGTLGDDHSYAPTPSADGGYVAFASDAHNLVPNLSGAASEAMYMTLARVR